MDFWDKIRKDLQRGVDEGVAFVKEGAAVVQKRAEELTEEGKRRYRLYELKTKVQKEISDLGGKVYDLSSKVKNPMLDAKVKAIKARIVKLQAEIMVLEGKAERKVKAGVASGKKTVKKTVKKVAAVSKAAAK